MALELWLAYLVVSFLFAITPGPAVLLTAGQAISRGFGAGFAVVLGTQAGNLVYFVLSAAGIGAILVTSETAFTIVKYLGAAYLIWLGARTMWNASHAMEPGPPARVPIWQHPFMQGLVNQLANPKSILFWGAMFPQFVDYHGGNLVAQFAILAATGVAADIVVLSSYALVATRGRRLLAAGPAAVWRERIAGGALVIVGVALGLVRWDR